MENIYIVKSFGHEGYKNLKVFKNHEEAEKYMYKIAKQIPEDCEDEWLEIEIFTLGEI